MQPEEDMEDGAPLVCSLDALDTAERNRREHLAGRLADRIATIGELANGFKIEFLIDDDAIFLMVAELITLERRCCPFLDFALQIRHQERRFLLSVTGGSGAKEVLTEELQHLFQNQANPGRHQL